MTFRAACVLVGALALLGPRAGSAEMRSTFTLDALSFISFGDDEILLLPPGSTIQFLFGTPDANGNVSFTIQPEDVSIAPVDLPAGGTLQYGIVAPASGTVDSAGGQKRLSFHATVRATLDAPTQRGSFDYAMPFTTENASASNLAGTETLAVTGMRVVNGIWYGQIVGATTNKENAFPEPGAAVYTVLSGQFDQMP